MGIGSNKQIRLMVAGVLLAAMTFAGRSAEAVDYDSGIWKVLRDGHFSGPMNDGAHVRPVKGILAANNGKRYRFWEYSYVNPETHHGRESLLVFEQAAHRLSYLGYYDAWFEDFKGPVHPEIRGQSLFFPYHELVLLGGKSDFSTSFANGPPPKLTPDQATGFKQ